MAEYNDKTALKLRLREERYETERLMREKRSEEMEALEEVFDKPTLMIIYRMLNSGILKDIFGVVKSGKESRLYWGRDSKEKDVAIKIYLTGTSEFRKGMIQYIDGDNRFKRVPRSTRALIYLWAKKEFKNLLLATKAGVRAPKPIKVEGNVLLMEFIGEDGVPAPLLREEFMKKPRSVYRKLMGYIELLYEKAQLVHGDLSEYNIMMWKGKPVIFDFSQTVKIGHPLTHELLKRDISNLTRFFEVLRVKVESVDIVYERVVGKHGKHA